MSDMNRSSFVRDLRVCVIGFMGRDVLNIASGHHVAIRLAGPLSTTSTKFAEPGEYY